MDFLAPTQQLDSTETDTDESRVEKDVCATLKLLDGSDKCFDIFQGENFIGRDPTKCSILLDSEVSISRIHAIIDGQNDGCAIMDKTSSNGTFKGNLKLKPNVFYALENGDLIKCGKINFKFVLSDNNFLIPETPQVQVKSKKNVSLNESSSFLAPSQPTMRDSCILDMETQAVQTGYTCLLEMETQRLKPDLQNDSTKGSQTMEIDDTLDSVAKTSHNEECSKTSSEKMDDIFDQPTQATDAGGNENDENESNASEDLLDDIQHEEEDDDLVLDSPQKINETADDDVFESDTQIQEVENEPPENEINHHDAVENPDEVDHTKRGDQIDERENATQIEESDDDDSSIDLIPCSQEEEQNSRPLLSSLIPQKSIEDQTALRATKIIQDPAILSQEKPEKPNDEEHPVFQEKVHVGPSQSSEDFLGSTQLLMGPLDSQNEEEAKEEDEDFIDDKSSLSPSPRDLTETQIEETDEEEEIPNFDLEEEGPEAAEEKTEISENTDGLTEENIETAQNDEQTVKSSTEKAEKIENPIEDEQNHEKTINSSTKKVERKEKPIEEVEGEQSQHKTMKTETKEERENGQNYEQSVNKPAKMVQNTDTEAKTINTEDLKLEITESAQIETSEAEKEDKNTKAENSSSTKECKVNLEKLELPVKEKRSRRFRLKQNSSNAAKNSEEENANEERNKRKRSTAKIDKSPDENNLEEPRRSTRARRPSKRLQEISTEVNTRKRKSDTLSPEENVQDTRQSKRRTQSRQTPKRDRNISEKPEVVEDEPRNRRVSAAGIKNPPKSVRQSKEVETVKEEPKRGRNKRISTGQASLESPVETVEVKERPGRRKVSAAAKSPLKSKPDKPQNERRSTKRALSKVETVVEEPPKTSIRKSTRKANDTEGAKEQVQPRRSSSRNQKAQQNEVTQTNKRKSRGKSDIKEATVKLPKLDIPAKIVEAKAEKPEQQEIEKRKPRQKNEPVENKRISASMRKKSKPVVMLTGYENPTDIKIVKELGGLIANKVSDCTVLITDKVRRTAKFLCALGQGIPIVSPFWLSQSKMTKTFLDPWKHLVEDKEAEKKWGFSLQNSLTAASKDKLLDGYKVFATPSVLPSPKELKEIVQCAGGQYLEKLPTKSDPLTFVISCLDDKAAVSRAVKNGINIQDKEVLLTGLLKQKLDFDKHKLIM